MENFMAIGLTALVLLFGFFMFVIGHQRGYQDGYKDGISIAELKKKLLEKRILKEGK